MKRMKRNRRIAAALSAAALFAASFIFAQGCDLNPRPATAAGADGMIMYSGLVVLNGEKFEIVTNRVQQLQAVGPSGHVIEWSTSNPDVVDVTQTGLIRSGRTPNREAVISAASTLDPSIKAQVTFRTKGLR